VKEAQEGVGLRIRRRIAQGKVVLEVFEQVLKACVQVDKSSWRRYFFISQNCRGRTDGRNSPRRFREILWAVGSCRGARRLQCRCGKGSKLRKGRGAVDRDHEEQGSTRGSAYREFVR
jgi:hypothetical protein